MYQRLSCIRMVGVQLVIVAGMLTLAGCSVDVTPAFSVLNENGETGNIDDRIVVSFRNLAEDEAVDVEFYFVEGELENLPDDLFLAENRVGFETLIQGQGIGIANLATISPGEVDSVTLTCDRALTLGTTGGMFLDAETHEQRGQGTMIWLQQDAQFFCGAVIEFRYAADGDAFATAYSLDP